MQTNRMKVFVRSDTNDDNRPTCRIVLDGKDYSELTLEKGLSYTYPVFHINMSYLRATQQAAQNKRGLFTYPDEAHLVLLPWKFRSGIVHMNSYRGSSRQVDLCMQKGKFFKVCVLHMKARETLLEVKPSAIVGAGMGEFVKQSKRIEKENLICTYSDLPAPSVNGIDPDYHFQVFSGSKSMHYIRKRVISSNK